MKINRLRDVDPIAVSIVKKGANRKRWLLRKTDDGDELTTEPEGAELLVELPSSHGLLVKSDWSVAYCVVAEPGARENPGQGAPDPEIDDEWASAEEILKAAHRFMKNGALINRMHESLEPYGQVVENFIAPADLAIETPSGSQSILKGSWVIGIEPSDDGRAKIEEGEFTGVSLQGSGVRTLVEVEKAAPGHSHRKKQAKRLRAEGKTHGQIATAMGIPVGQVKQHLYKDEEEGEPAEVVKTPGPPGTDIARNQGKQFGPLKNLIGYYLKKPHPFGSCVRDNRKRFGARAEAVCAALKDIGLQTTHWRSGNKASLAKADGGAADAVASIYDAASESWHGRGLTDDDVPDALKALRAAERRNTTSKGGGVKRALKKMAEAVGIDIEDELQDEAAEGEETDLEKQVRTFGQIIAERQLEEDLPTAMDALRSSIYCAFYPPVYTDNPPTPDEIRGSLDSSLQQFHEYLLGLYDDTQSGDNAQASLSKVDALAAEGATLHEMATGHTTEEDSEMGDSTKIEELEGKVAEVSKAVTDLTEALQPVVDRVKDAQVPTPEELSKQVTDLTAAVGTVAANVEKLAAGNTTQPETPDTVVKSDDPLAGLLA